MTDRVPRVGTSGLVDHEGDASDGVGPTATAMSRRSTPPCAVRIRTWSAPARDQPGSRVDQRGSVAHDRGSGLMGRPRQGAPLPPPETAGTTSARPCHLMTAGAHSHEAAQAKRGEDGQRSLQKVPCHRRRIVAGDLCVGHHDPPVSTVQSGRSPARTGVECRLRPERRPPAASFRPSGGAGLPPRRCRRSLQRPSGARTTCRSGSHWETTSERFGSGRFRGVRRCSCNPEQIERAGVAVSRFDTRLPTMAAAWNSGSWTKPAPSWTVSPNAASAWVTCELSS